MKTIKVLKNIWKIDEKAFESKELGGLQSFVKDVFECEELFNLKQGNEITKIEKRKNEFTIEVNKKGHRADFVIYIKGNEIVIPVEVEKYNNIQAGEKQLAGYQNDWQKAYGILTDGYHWRFYNNTSYKEFILPDMLNNPSILKTFWEDYLKEENYYLTYFQKPGEQNSFFEYESLLKIDDNRELFFEDITKLITNFKNKLDIVGYLEENGTYDSNKRATEISYAYIIQFILYKNLVDNYYGNFNKEFEKRLVNIYNGLITKTYEMVSVQIYGISKFISDKLYKPFNEEQKFITKKIHSSISNTNLSFQEITLWLDIIVFIKKYNFSNMQKEIFGYVYENYLKELYEDKNKGQYFTDPAVVEFMLDELGYTEKKIKTLYNNRKLDKLSIIDPACGSGTFLYSTVNRIVNSLFDGTEKRSKEIEELINNNIFGLDIAEFPLYLAEMNILMRMLPMIICESYNNPIDKKIKVFKTNDSISEFMDVGITANMKKDINENGQWFIPFETSNLNLQYTSYIRDEDDLKEMKQSMRIPRRRFDFVVGNPPYIGYNTCCNQNLLFTKLIKQKKLSMGNIYGVNLNTVPKRIKPYSPKPNLFSFFIALGIALLKQNGKICFIIPQTILTANDLDVLRYYLSKETCIEKLITFDGKMFIGRGLKGNKPIPTSSLIFIISKKKQSKENKVKIINYGNIGESNFHSYLKSRKKKIKTVLQGEFFNKIENWNFIKFADDYKIFIDNYNHSICLEEYRHTFGDYDLIMFDKGLVFKKKNIVKNKSDFQLISSSINVTPTYLDSYISTYNLIFPSGAQGIKVYKKKYKIIWSYTKPRFYFSDKDVMIGSNWLIISSDNKSELLFLYALLFSKINIAVLTNYAKTSGEKLLIISIKSIKEFIRIPKINIQNKIIKEKIIIYTEKLINFENVKLSDLVDFSNIEIQKFNKYKLYKNYLLLSNNNNNYKVKIINHRKFKCIKKSLELNLINKEEFSLTELKNLIVIDKSEQKKIKDFIDDLVFSLYFNIPIDNINISEAKIIKNKCRKNKFYKLIEK